MRPAPPSGEKLTLHPRRFPLQLPLILPLLPSRTSAIGRRELRKNSTRSRPNTKNLIEVKLDTFLQQIVLSSIAIEVSLSLRNSVKIGTLRWSHYRSLLLLKPK